MTPFIRISLILASLTLGACAHFSDNASQTSTLETALGAAKNKNKISYGDFNIEQDTLYDLLVAELAAQRGQLNVALLNYIQQARITRDPAIIRRAINAAQFSKDFVAIQELSLLWIEVEPENASAHQLLAFQHSIQKNYADAIYHINQVLKLKGKISVESLAISSQSLPLEEKEELLTLYQNLLADHPNNIEVLYSIAIVQRNLKQYDEALSNLNIVLSRNPTFQPAAVLKSNTLYEKGDSEQAFNFSKEAYSDFPGNHAIGRLYASMLIDQGELEDAEEVFKELLDLYPQSPSLKLSHALVMLENKKIAEATMSLQQLLAAKAHTNESHFYLGRIADQSNDKDLAVSHYLQVTKSLHFEPAIERASFLLMQDGKFDAATEALNQIRAANPSMAAKLWILQFKQFSAAKEDARALKTLDQALTAFPDSEPLLYARAMLRDQDHQLDAMEADLRRILEINPQNAVAMNALGYTLADKTDRLQEAFSLISIALQLKPENPAIMDSMGWVLFKLGKREEALAFLLKAFQVFPDGEVGAHLGEILLSLNQFTEAQQVWIQTLKISPDHPILIRTLERLAPELIQNKAEQEATDTPTENNTPTPNEETEDPQTQTTNDAI